MLAIIWDKKEGLSAEDRQALGFRDVAEDASEEEKSAAGEHNWNNLNTLLDGRGWYNPKAWIWGYNYVDDTYPDQAEGLDRVYNKAREYYNDLYHFSIRRNFSFRPEVVYRVPLIGSEIQFAKSRSITIIEIQNYIAEVSGQKEFQDLFVAQDKAAKTQAARDALAQRQWEFMEKAFPGLRRILSRDPREYHLISRGPLETAFENATGIKWNETAMMTNWQNNSTGMKVVPIAYRDKMVDDTLAPGLDELTRLLAAGAQ